MISMETVVVLCEGYFGANTGKTANGLVRYSKRYAIVGVLDSTKAGRDAGEVLDGRPAGTPIFRDLKDALARLPRKPDVMIIGVATFGGYIPKEFRPVIREAIEAGISVAAGLHEYLSDDPEFGALAARHGVRLIDVRKPRPLRELEQFSDRARQLPCLRIPVLGTDGSIGKRTTAILLTEALNAAGVKAEFVATGQTGLLQGARYGVAIDSIKGDFMVGELESQIVMAYEENRPEVVVVEGQGSISHPAYVCGTRAILMASMPSGIVLQHAPARKTRNFRRDVVTWPMPSVEREIAMLELFSDSKVIALTLNHENLAPEDVARIETEYEGRYGLPTCDPLLDGCGKLVNKIRAML